MPNRMHGKATASELGGSKVMSVSSFCVISGKEVKTIVSGSTSEETIGGTTAGLCEEKSTDRLIIYKNSYTGGFGGNVSDSCSIRITTVLLHKKW